MTLADLLVNSSLFPNPGFQWLQSPRASPTASFSFSLALPPIKIQSFYGFLAFIISIFPIIQGGVELELKENLLEGGEKIQPPILVLGGGKTCWFGGENSRVRRIWRWWNGTKRILNHALNSLFNTRASVEGDKSNLGTAASSKASHPSRDVVSAVLMVLCFYRMLVLSVVWCGIGLQNSEAQIRSFWLSRAPFWKCPNHDNFAQFSFQSAPHSEFYLSSHHLNS